VLNGKVVTIENYHQAPAASATVSKCGYIIYATGFYDWEGDVTRLTSPDTGLSISIETLRKAVFESVHIQYSFLLSFS